MLVLVAFSVQTMKKLNYILILILLSIIIVPALMSTAKSQFKVNNSSANKIKVTNLQKGMVGYWDMDQTSLKSSTVLADKTVNANNGTLVGSPSFTTDRNWQNNKAINFDGTNDEILPSTAQVVSGNGTISLWVKPTSGGGPIDGNGQYYTYYPFVYTYSGRLQLGLSNLGGTSASEKYFYFNNFPGFGTWYNITIVVSSNSWQMYVNGVSSYTSALSSTNAFPLKRIGYGATRFTGPIDDVRVYNRALSAAEITQLYGSYNPKIQVSTLQKGLVGYWPLDQQSLKSSTVVADKTVNANDGTMVGSPSFTTDQNGQANKAMSFNGSSQYVNSSYQPSGLTAVSASFWFNLGTTSITFPFGFQSGTDAFYVYMRQSDGLIGFGIESTNFRQIQLYL